MIHKSKSQTNYLDAKFGGGGTLGAGGPPTPTGGKLVELPVSYLGILIIVIVIIFIVIVIVIIIIIIIIVTVIIVIFI